MKIIVKDNLKAVKDNNVITMFINDEMVWISKNLETNKQVIEVKDADSYKIVIKLLDKNIDKTTTKSFKNSLIKVTSAKAHPALGLRGMLWGPLINIFRKKYGVKVKQIKS